MTSISVFPDKSPQLQEKGVPTRLNSFTTKNVSIRDSRGREFNAIINDRLAYRRAPRGQNVEDFSEILYGPNVVQLSKKNYKKMKKGRITFDCVSFIKLCYISHNEETKKNCNIVLIFNIV